MGYSQPSEAGPPEAGGGKDVSWGVATRACSLECGSSGGRVVRPELPGILVGLGVERVESANFFVLHGRDY